MLEVIITGAHNIFYESDINRSIAFAAIYKPSFLVYGNQQRT
jgi:hypothetical protein